MRKPIKVFLFLFLVHSPWSIVHSPLLFASDPISDYALAQKCYHSLDKSSARGWNHCIHQFQNVLERYAGTEFARKALFTIGRMHQEKYDLVGDAKDLKEAFQTYNQFLRDYPEDSLADDALYRIAKLRLEKEHDREKALRALSALVERYPDGDMKEAALKDLERIKNGTTSPGDQDFALRTVVIDPGHGGRDPGAKGRGGTTESEISLQIARKLAFQLKKNLSVQVFLTRTNPHGVSLEARDLFANTKKADLFISIHANAHRSRKISGVQTFYLNNAASEASKLLQERENKANGKELPLTQKILNTMLQNADTLESKDLAFAVQRSLVQRLRKDYSNVQDLKVDTALFYVLVGAKCPGILVETSFITNPMEEKRLKDSQYQWTVAGGISEGVRQYVESRKTLANAPSL